MKPQSELKTDIYDGSALAVPHEPRRADETGMMADRGTPNWARYVSFLFAIGTGACLIAVAVLAIFFQSLVAIEGNRFVVPLLLGISAVPILGSLILDYCHARALAGYRAARERTEALAQAAVAALIVVVLSILHPFLGLAIPLCAAAFAGTLWLLRRFGTPEKLWEFRPAEAAAMLAGRDELGLSLAAADVREHALAPHFHRAFSWLALILGFAIASWLAARDVVALPAVAGIGLISYWATDAFGRHIRMLLQPDVAAGNASAQVEQLALTEDGEQAAAALAGLSADNISVETAAGERLLSEVSVSVAPGEVIGIVGDAASGKSLLLQALTNPFDLPGLHVRGRVSINETDMWDRQNKDRRAQMVHLPPTPRILPASGIDNLTCFIGDSLADRGLRCLESLIFSTDAVDRISAAPDATCLSSSDQKALAFARAFLLSPSVYLMDRPEDFASEKLLAALVDRIKMEAHAGRSFLIITDNRAILECCSKLLMLRDGRVVDFAPAAEIRGRMSSGWLRFVTPRRLESEDTLATWIKSHFKRGGDEANRVKLCTVAAELLAFSCQDVRPMSLERVCFDFKHFEGFALLKLIDESPLVSSGQMQLAHREAAEIGKDAGRLSPLGKVVHLAEEIEQELVDNRRVIRVKIATYDPRKGRPKPDGSAKDASQSEGDHG
ncbi:MAG: ATP-binding cassette domain-containing protein [Pseudomonadota bacterium]